MGVEASSNGYVDGEAEIHWACGQHGLHVDGHQTLAKATSFQGHIRSLLNINVPPIARVCVTRGYTVPLTRGIQRNGNTCVVVAWIKNWAHVHEFTTALTRTSHLQLNLPDGPMNAQQEAMNAGYMLGVLVCGRSRLALTEPIAPTAGPDTIRPDYHRLDLTYLGVSDRLFAAVCSAVADASDDANLSSLWMGVDGSGRWPWLVYALCCGTSDDHLDSVKIRGGTLTMSDILAISAALQTNYPQPIMKSERGNHHNYGFVDVREGTKVLLCGIPDLNEIGDFVVASACRYRAQYDPADGKWVHLVVPGYGAGKAKLGGGVTFTPDSGKSELRAKRLSASLRMTYVRFESPEVLMDLLRLVTPAGFDR